MTDLKSDLKALCDQHGFVEVLARLRDLVDDEDTDEIADDCDFEEASPRSLSDQLDGALELASICCFEPNGGQWVQAYKEKLVKERAQREEQRKKYQEELDRQTYARLKVKFEQKS